MCAEVGAELTAVYCSNLEDTSSQGTTHKTAAGGGGGGGEGCMPRNIGRITHESSSPPNARC